MQNIIGNGRQLFPLHTLFYRLSDYYITDPRLSLIVKHAIWQFINDHHFPTLKSIRALGIEPFN
jgi:hypothetical protein